MTAIHLNKQNMNFISIRQNFPSSSHNMVCILNQRKITTILLTQIHTCPTHSTDTVIYTCICINKSLANSLFWSMKVQVNFSLRKWSTQQLSDLQSMALDVGRRWREQKGLEWRISEDNGWARLLWISNDGRWACDCDESSWTTNRLGSWGSLWMVGGLSNDECMGLTSRLSS